MEPRRGRARNRVLWVLPVPEQKRVTWCRRWQSRVYATMQMEPSEAKPVLEKSMQDKLLLGMKEAAETMSCSPWTVRKLIYSGRLVGVKVGARLCVERVELERFVVGNRTKRGRR